MLSSLKGLVPSDWKVIVTADRGLYADWLYQAIVNLGWHPFLRINHQGQYQIPNSSDWNPLATVVPSPGMSWSGQVTCFKTNPIDCTLLARWDEGYADPWLILTDLTPADANVSWYGFRSWIESSYRDVKSDGWQWQRTRLTNPERAERQWLAMAVALLWTITLGSEQEAESEREVIANGSESLSMIPLRQISCFLNPTFGSPTDEAPLKSPKNRAGIGQKKVNLINGIIVSVNNTLTTLNKTINSQ